MRQTWIVLMVSCLLFPLMTQAQDLPDSSKVAFDFAWEPATAGFRLDDNVYRSVTQTGVLSDEIMSGDWGAEAKLNYEVFRGLVNYHVGDDQYMIYTDLNNLKNDVNALLAVEPGDWDFYYKFDYFLRASQYFDFNYFDVASVAGARWTPPGVWNYEIQYKNLARQYFDTDPAVWSRNFLDQSGVFSVQREIDDLFSLKLTASYTNRQFNRYAINQTGMTISPQALQNDNTWKVNLNAHWYIFSILQDVNIEGQRTDSNSYGFSNTVESFSWAGVIRPVVGFYFQLLFRLYLKTYDAPPLTNQDLQLGFIDEDSQDLLTAKANWDMGRGWVSSLGVSRIRSESDQPDAYYVKDIISAQLRKNF